MSHNQDFSEQPLPTFLPNPDFFIQLEEINRMLQEIQERQLVTEQNLELATKGMKEAADRAAAREAESMRLVASVNSLIVEGTKQLAKNKEFLEAAREHRRAFQTQCELQAKHINKLVQRFEKRDNSDYPF